jgi:hypothetical protein
VFSVELWEVVVSCFTGGLVTRCGINTGAKSPTAYIVVKTALGTTTGILLPPDPFPNTQVVPVRCTIQTAHRSQRLLKQNPHQWLSNRDPVSYPACQIGPSIGPIAFSDQNHAVANSNLWHNSKLEGLAAHTRQVTFQTRVGPDSKSKISCVSEAW